MLDDEPTWQQPDQTLETGPAQAPDDTLYCAVCGAPVTRTRWATSRRDAHEHVVFNPTGHLFRLRCFSQAPGAYPVGPPSDHFTWFPGHDWQVALCLGCDRHLGWKYLSARDYLGFWGLDARTLTKRPD